MLEKEIIRAMDEFALLGAEAKKLLEENPGDTASVHTSVVNEIYTRMAYILHNLLLFHHNSYIVRDQFSVS